MCQSENHAGLSEVNLMQGVEEEGRRDHHFCHYTPVYFLKLLEHILFL